MVKTKRRMRPRWQFGWCDENSSPANGDSHDWKTKVFRVATLKAAMDLMLAFVRSQPFVCLVDYEVAALHVPYRKDRHDQTFHRIDDNDHELNEYVG